MTIRLQIAVAAIALMLGACVTQQPRTEVERQQENTESRAGEARMRAENASAAARDRIRTAEAQSRHRIARADCDTLSSESARYNCFAAADAKLEQDLRSH
jgi:hypothetical protein